MTAATTASEGPAGQVAGQGRAREDSRAPRRQPRRARRPRPRRRPRRPRRPRPRTRPLPAAGPPQHRPTSPRSRQPARRRRARRDGVPRPRPPHRPLTRYRRPPRKRAAQGATMAKPAETRTATATVRQRDAESKATEVGAEDRAQRGRDREDPGRPGRAPGRAARGVRLDPLRDHRAAARPAHRLGRRRPGRHRYQDVRARAGDLAREQHPGTDHPGRARPGAARRGRLRLVRAVRQPHPGRAAGRLPVGYPLRDLQAAGGAALTVHMASAGTRTGRTRSATAGAAARHRLRSVDAGRARPRLVPLAGGRGRAGAVARRHSVDPSSLVRARESRAASPPVRTPRRAALPRPHPQQRRRVQHAVPSTPGSSRRGAARRRLDRVDGDAAAVGRRGRSRWGWSLGGALGNLTDRLFRAPGVPGRPRGRLREPVRAERPVLRDLQPGRFRAVRGGGPGGAAGVDRTAPRRHPGATPVDAVPDSGEPAVAAGTRRPRRSAARPGDLAAVRAVPDRRRGPGRGGRRRWSTGSPRPKSDKVSAGAWLEVTLPAPPGAAAPSRRRGRGRPDRRLQRRRHRGGGQAGRAWPRIRSPGWTGPTVTGGLAAMGQQVATSGAAERQGVVHRLDVGTTGLMVVAKSERAYSAAQARVQGARGGQAVPRGGAGAPGPAARHRSTRPSTGTRRSTGSGRWSPAASRASPTTTRWRRSRRRAWSTCGWRPGAPTRSGCTSRRCGTRASGILTYGADPTLAARLGLTRQWLHARELSFAHPAYRARRSGSSASTPRTSRALASGRCCGAAELMARRRASPVGGPKWDE